MIFKKDSIFRRLRYYSSVLPMIGRSNYRRLNERLDRQIKIRNDKRNLEPRRNSKFFADIDRVSAKELFFDIGI